MRHLTFRIFRIFPHFDGILSFFATVVIYQAAVSLVETEATSHQEINKTAENLDLRSKKMSQKHLIVFDSILHAVYGIFSCMPTGQ